MSPLGSALARDKAVLNSAGNGYFAEPKNIPIWKRYARIIKFSSEVNVPYGESVQHEGNFWCLCPESTPASPKTLPDKPNTVRNNSRNKDPK